ncbi:MAG: ABC transporter permease [Endomicrobiia bacterium]|nr:ABC transporter permease [Endomicrobiia bacterium]
MFRYYFDRLKRNKRAVAGLSAISAIFILGVLAPVIAPRTPFEQNLVERLKPPSRKALMGTDDLGRDVLSRMLYSVRVSFAVGFTAVGISVLIGTFVGILSGYSGGKTDAVIMRFVDVMLCFPTFFLILMVIAFLEPGILAVMAIIGLTSWMGLSRLVRAEVMSLKEREFALAARLLGLKKRRIFFVHILPNVVSPILVSATMSVGSAILIESGLSFLGLGVMPPEPSWGQMISSGKDYIHLAWWLSLFPGLAILATVLSFNMLGEGLRDVFDPKL